MALVVDTSSDDEDSLPEDDVYREWHKVQAASMDTPPRGEEDDNEDDDDDDDDGFEDALEEPAADAAPEEPTPAAPPPAAAAPAAPPPPPMTNMPAVARFRRELNKRLRDRAPAFLVASPAVVTDAVCTAFLTHAHKPSKRDPNDLTYAIGTWTGMAGFFTQAVEHDVLGRARSAELRRRGALKHCGCAILGTDDDGRAVILVRYAELIKEALAEGFDPINFCAVWCLFYAYFTVASAEACPAGICVVHDMRNARMRDLFYIFKAGHLFGPPHLRALAGPKRAFPIKIARVVVMHNPWYFHLLVAFAKPFVPAKLLERLHLLGEDEPKDFAGLKAAVSPRLLPPDLGGENEARRDTAAAWEDIACTAAWTRTEDWLATIARGFGVKVVGGNEDDGGAAA